MSNAPLTRFYCGILIQCIPTDKWAQIAEGSRASVKKSSTKILMGQVRIVSSLQKRNKIFLLYIFHSLIWFFIDWSGFHSVGNFSQLLFKSVLGMLLLKGFAIVSDMQTRIIYLQPLKTQLLQVLFFLKISAWYILSLY